MTKTKDSAVQYLNQVIKTSNKLINHLKVANNKLHEITELERDSFIGLTLTSSQAELLRNKQAYLVLKETIEELNPTFTEDIEDTIKTCVESIFLEKKEERKVEVFEEKRVPVINVKVVEEVPEEKFVQDEKEEIIESVYPKVRVPYAWKGGSKYENERERKKTDRNSMPPHKEVRGWAEKKRGNNSEINKK